MAIPRLEKQNIIEALNFIDKNGVPNYNVGNKYVLVSESGKKYPLKYVLAVADHLANGVDISIKSFNSDEVKKYLESQGFTVENKQQEKFELQPRQSEREYVSGETLYVWGHQYFLQVEYQKVYVITYIM